MAIDLSQYSFDEWLDFVFKQPGNLEDWHFGEEWEYECDGTTLINYMTLLFCSSEKMLIGRYSMEEIDSGLGLWGKLITQFIH